MSTVKPKLSENAESAPLTLPIEKMSTVKQSENAESDSLALPFEIEKDKIIVYSDPSTDEEFVNHTKLCCSRVYDDFYSRLSHASILNPLSTLAQT